MATPGGVSLISIVGFNAAYASFTFEAPAIGPIGSVSGVISTAFGFSSSALSPLFGVASSSWAFSAPIVATDWVGDISTDSTVNPDRVGVIPIAPFSSTKVVLSGVTSRTSGSAAVLAGNYGFRSLVTFDTTPTVPGNFVTDARGFVTIASWGDATLKVRRESGTAYEVRADFITAASNPTWSRGFIIVSNDDPTNLGLGMTRNSTTGLITLWRSSDSWTTWQEIPSSSRLTSAGALADSIPENITALDGDLQDGAWLQLFQLQWAETDDITSLDANEVAAWNYGSNIVTGLGGDFYDAINRDVNSLVERGANTSYVYKMRSQVTSGGRTIRADFTVNAPTLATGTPTTGTEAEFTFDAMQQLESGPNLASTLPPISFTTTTSFTIAGGGYGYSSTGSGFGIYSVDGQRPSYTVVLVDQQGTPQWALENAVVEDPIEWSLDEPESFTFTLPTLDPLGAYISAPDQEVQIWRGDQLLVWGVVVRPMAKTDVIEYQCRGLGWYFTKRIIGRAKTNLAPDGSFEAGAGWFSGQYAPTEPAEGRNVDYWDTALTTEHALTGGRSLWQSATADMTFGIYSYCFLFSTIDPTVDVDGIIWTASAWVYVPEESSARSCAYQWTGESAPTGLTLARMSTTEWQESTPEGVDDGDTITVPPGITVPKLYETQIASITEDTPRNTWHRLQVELTQPNDGTTRTDWIQVNLGTPIGAVFWDEIVLTRSERLFYNEVDQARIVEGVVQHAQDPAYGKSDLNIDTFCQDTGVSRTRSYWFYNHDHVNDVLAEYSEVWKGMDWSIDCTANTRTFVTHFPMKGARRPAHALILGKNIADFSIPTDGEQVANSVVVMADFGSTGANREEAYASDATGFASGLVLEEAFNAISESPITTLQDQAERRMRQGRVPVVIPAITTMEGKGAELLGAISTGDVVPVDIQAGSVDLYGDYRIVGIALDPATETMKLTLNPFEEWNDPARTWGIIT